MRHWWLFALVLGPLALAPAALAAPEAPSPEASASPTSDAIDPDSLPAPAESAGTAPEAPALPGAVPGPGTGALPAIGGWREQAAPTSASIAIALPPLSAPIAYQERTNGQGWQLCLPGVAAPEGSYALHDPVLPSLNAHGTADGTTITIPWKYACPTQITLAPGQLVVTFQTTFQQDTREALAPGVVHEHLRRANPEDGPIDVNVLHVDPHTPGVRVAPALADDNRLFARETVSGIARRSGAIAAINGAYFSFSTGGPVGLVMIDHQVVSAPIMNRSALAIAEDGGVFIDNTQLSSRLVLASGESYDFDGINQPRGLNRMVLYTPRFGASTRTAPGGHEWTLGPDGTVQAEAGADSPIPAGGSVLSAQGQPAAWLARHLHPGVQARIETPLASFWPGVRDALGGGPTLLRNGEIQITAEAEQFKPDITAGRAPRTAVGVTPAGEILLVTVDGRQSRWSRGVTLQGLASLLQQLGANDAINLDGGGSTAMAIGSQVVNRPSDGSERRVADALVVYASAPAPN